MDERRTLGALTLQPVRCFAGVDDLPAGLSAADPWLGPSIKGLDVALPAPPTVAAFTVGSFCRLPTSARCFYYFPSAAEDVRSARGGGVIAYKGLEPCAPDFCDLLADFRRAGPSPHDIAEHFVHEERKAPGCLLLDEAMFEAERASTFQMAHLSGYGEPAHAPYPLFVFRHTDETVARTAGALRQHLSAPAFRAVERQLAGGLGVYVYYYPSLPIRVRDVDFLLQGIGFRDRLLAILAEVCDPDEVAETWVRGFARMLHCGFAPGSLASLRTGVCCQSQNACIDGGFVDLDSLTPFEDLIDDTAVSAALQFSVDALIDTVRTMIGGRVDPTRDGGSAVQIDLHYYREYVLELLRKAVQREARPGLRLDPRVSTYLTPPTGLAALVDRLGAYYPRPSAFEKETREFKAGAQRLFRAARRDPRP